MDTKEIFMSDLKEMDLSGCKPAIRTSTLVTVNEGDRFRMTMQGLGGKELYLIEIIRKWEK